MAYLREYLEFVNDSINLEYYNTAGLSMFELGNQRFAFSGCSTGKEYFTNKGMHHTSVDINGEDGALPLDLTKPEMFGEFKNKYDILTNLGTTEHVEPIDKQYDCFSIIHSVVKPGGIMIHMVPDVEEYDVSGAWNKHCNIYYRKEFFTQLVEHCNYTMLDSKVIFGLRCVVMRKEVDQMFTTNKDIFGLIEAR